MNTRLSNPDAPPELAAAVGDWLERDSPNQLGIPWPRDRWVETFPAHAALLQALPLNLDRVTLQTVCSSAATDREAATAAFIAVLAWGYGRVGYGVWRAEQALAMPRAAEHLHEAVLALRSDGALAGYSSLAQPSHRLPRFGPAFGTKFLAFCSSSPTKPALIFDKLVSRWLERNAGVSLNPVPWSVQTYQRYLELTYEWSDALGVTPEDVELCMFTAESARAGNQWANRP